MPKDHDDAIRDTWTSRELPVLRTVVSHLDSASNPDTYVRASTLARAMDRSEAEVTAALANLFRGGYLVPPSGVGAPRDAAEAGIILDFTEKALREIGQWPTPESGLERMIAALESIAADQYEPEAKRSRARTILGALGGAGRDLGVDVAGAVIAFQMT